MIREKDLTQRKDLGEWEIRISVKELKALKRGRSVHVARIWLEDLVASEVYLKLTRPPQKKL